MMPLEHSCLVEKKDNAIVRGWKHFYNAEIPFPGYKNMSADAVTLGFSRDIILDLFNKIPVGMSTSTKPASGEEALKKWIAKIAENMRHVYRSKRETRTTADVITWLIIGVDVLMFIAWLIKFLV